MDRFVIGRGLICTGTSFRVGESLLSIVERLDRAIVNRTYALCGSLQKTLDWPGYLRKKSLSSLIMTISSRFF